MTRQKGNLPCGANSTSFNSKRNEAPGGRIFIPHERRKSAQFSISAPIASSLRQSRCRLLYHQCKKLALVCRSLIRCLRRIYSNHLSGFPLRGFSSLLGLDSRLTTTGLFLLVGLTLAPLPASNPTVRAWVFTRHHWQAWVSIGALASGSAGMFTPDPSACGVPLITLQAPLRATSLP